MIRGMGNTVRGLTPLCSAIAGHAMGPGYANGGQVGFASSGMAPGFANGGMPRYDRGGLVGDTNPQTYTSTDRGGSRQQANPYYIDPRQSSYVTGPGATQAQWQPRERSFYGDYAGYLKAKPTGGESFMGAMSPGAAERGGQTMGPTYYSSPQYAADIQAWQNYGRATDLIPGPSSPGVLGQVVNYGVPALVAYGISAGAGAALGAGTPSMGGLGASSVGPAAGANAGIGTTYGATSGAAGAGTAGMAGTYGGAYSGGMSQIPASSFGQSAAGANMSRVPFDYAGNGAAFGAGASASSAYPEYTSPQWQAQNSSQIPQYSQYDPAAGQGAQMSQVGGPGNFMNNLYPYSGSGVGGGMGGGGFSQANGIGTQPAQVNPNYSGVDSPQMSSYEAPSSNTYTNQGFNTPMGSNYGGFDGTGGGQAYGDFGGSGAESGAQNLGNTNAAMPTIQPKPGVMDRVMGGAKQTMQNLPENFGKALPGMAASLGVAALTGGFKGNQGQNDPGYQYAQQQAQTDVQRNQMALASQQEFAANASKYGSDDYYRQMGDMSSMQFRSGRVAQRQELQRQLAAQGRDPTTINAMLQQFDNSTETGAVNAQNSSYLSARNAGLGSQQAAAGMYGSGQGAQTLSNINTSANYNQLARNQALGNFVSAPFNAQSQAEGRASGSNVNQAADQAAKAATKNYGLDSTAFGRGN